MKKIKLILTFLLLISAFLNLISCNEELPDNSFITISKKNINFEETGEEVPITAQIFSNDPEAVPEWTSSNPEVAVYENGNIRAVGYGTCVIRASYKNVSATCTVYFKDPYSSIILSSQLFEFNSIGEISSVTAHSGARDLTSSVIWKSSNPEIASCNQNGIITTKGYGACTIMARMDSKTAITSVIVTDPDAKKLTLSKTELSVNEGESFTLTAEKSYNAGSNVTWISSNPEILECENGVITAKTAGICSVIAVTELGASDACTVTVGEPIPLEYEIPENLLSFTMPKIPHTTHTVNGESGEIIASANVTSITAVPALDKKTDRLYLQIYLHCVKVYDASGINGTNPVHISTNLYRENDYHCERRLYKNEGLKIGNEFTITCALFMIQTEPDVRRIFYMTLENVCET